MSIDCKNGELVKNGLRKWIQCNKINKVCPFQRYCTNRQTIVYTDSAVKCKIRNENK